MGLRGVVEGFAEVRWEWEWEWEWEDRGVGLVAAFVTIVRLYALLLRGGGVV